MKLYIVETKSKSEPATAYLAASAPATKAQALESARKLRERSDTLVARIVDAKNPAAVALGRLGGEAKTPAKSEASRINGRKGGRPKGGKNKPKQFGPLP